jgi:hypothetical protein
VHGDKTRFVEVDSKPGGSGEVVQNSFEARGSLGVRLADNKSVIRMRKRIQSSGTPLRSTTVCPVVKMRDIQEHQRSSNPLALRIQRTLSQFTKSKAFLKSILKTTVGALRRWQHRKMSAA